MLKNIIQYILEPAQSSARIGYWTFNP